MRPERAVQKHPVVQYRPLGLEVSPAHPGVLAQRFAVVGLRQGEQGQLIVPDLCIADFGADSRFVFHSKSPFRLAFNVFCGNGGK